VVPTDEAYFHTKEWQEGEAQADKDRKKGDVLGPFDNLKNGLKALKPPKYEAPFYQKFCPQLP